MIIENEIIMESRNRLKWCVHRLFGKSSYGQIVIEIAASHAIGPNVIVKFAFSALLCEQMA